MSSPTSDDRQSHNDAKVNIIDLTLKQVEEKCMREKTLDKKCAIELLGGITWRDHVRKIAMERARFQGRNFRC